MYFWKLSALKRDLAAAPLSTRQTLFYLLWFWGISIAGYGFSIENPNVWDHIDSGVMVVAFVLGTIYFYHRNGGASGTDFLGRYMSLGWVFGLRFFVVLVVLMLPASVVIEWVLPDGLSEESTPAQSTVLAAIDALYYIRLGHHVSDVQRLGNA